MVQTLWETVLKFLKTFDSYHPTQQFYSLVGKSRERKLCLYKNVYTSVNKRITYNPKK